MGRWHRHHHHRRTDWKGKVLILIIILAFFGYFTGALKIDTNKINLESLNISLDKFNLTKEVNKPLFNKFLGKWQTQQGFIYETITMEFTRDGRGNMVTPYASDIFTYEILDKNKIQIKEGNNNPKIWRYEFVGDTLILGKEGRDYKMAFVKVD